MRQKRHDDGIDTATRLLRGIAFAALLTFPLAPAVQAQAVGTDPFVFVLDRDENGRAGSGYAWWLLARIIRPTGTMVAGVALGRINDELGPMATPWCFANAFTTRSFVSPVRTVQREIDESLSRGGESLFRGSGPFTGGEAQDAVVGNYETCGGDHGAFLLITNRAEPRNIVYLHQFADWDGLIWMSQIEEGIAVHSCFECGHAEALFFDRERRQFYWRNIGD